jgi:hypothetical protein
MRPELRRPAFWVSAAVALALVALVGSAGAAREVVHVGDLFLADDGGIFPSRLPREGRAPIQARLEAEIGTVDGTHPPALHHIDLLIDRTIALDAAGLPTCRLGQIEATSTAAAKRACQEAIVGSGKATVEVAFPEQEPFSSTGPLVLFNGGVRGTTTRMLLHAYVDVPAPTAIVVPAEIGPRPQRPLRPRHPRHDPADRRRRGLGHLVRADRRAPLHPRGQEGQSPDRELPDRALPDRRRSRILRRHRGLGGPPISLHAGGLSCSAKFKGNRPAGSNATSFG